LIALYNIDAAYIISALTFSKGLYYSYYKTMAEAPSVMSGLHDLVRCNITEYPDKVNVLRRFNLYPEVFFMILLIYHY